MNKKFIGSDARDEIKRWEKEDPVLRSEIDKSKNKKEMPKARNRAISFSVSQTACF